MQTRSAFAAAKGASGVGKRVQMHAQLGKQVCTGKPPRRSKRIRTNDAIQSPGASVRQHVASILNALTPLTDKTSSKEMEVYVRGQFTFYGISAPKRRAATKSIIADIRKQSAEDPSLPWQTCAALWDLDMREMQYVGLDILDACRKQWMHADTVGFADMKTYLERFVGEKQWWDSIDLLASHPVVDAYSVYREEMRSTLERWIVDDDVWFRRTALLFQLRSKTETDSEMLFRFVRLRMGDEEFWIRKAIGWALRSYRRTDASAVDCFVEDNLDRLSKLSVREAWKHKT